MKKILLFLPFLSLFTAYESFCDDKDFTPYNVLTSNHSTPGAPGSEAEGILVLGAATAAGAYQGGKALGKGLNKLGEKIFSTGSKMKFEPCIIINDEAENMHVTGFGIFNPGLSQEVKPNEQKTFKTPFMITIETKAGKLPIFACPGGQLHATTITDTLNALSHHDILKLQNIQEREKGK